MMNNDSSSLSGYDSWDPMQSIVMVELVQYGRRKG
jgi:hypothetical protein